MRERPEKAGDRTSSVVCSVISTGYDSPPAKPEPIWPTGKRNDAFRPRSEVRIPVWTCTASKVLDSKPPLLRTGKCHTDLRNRE
jgi:hypothetical protein